MAKDGGDMRGAPVHPDEYDGERLNTDEKLRDEAWAAGLRVWQQIGKAYEWYLGQGEQRGDEHPGGLDNAQMWSLQQAIRAQALAAVWRHVVFDISLAPDLAILAAARELGVVEQMADYLLNEGDL
jgi:hypothetical protein